MGQRGRVVAVGADAASLGVVRPLRASVGPPRDVGALQRRRAPGKGAAGAAGPATTSRARLTGRRPCLAFLRQVLCLDWTDRYMFSGGADSNLRIYKPPAGVSA